MLTPAERWCLLHGLAAGSWSSGGWVWSAESRSRCGFRYHTAAEAREVLAGRHIVFIGNSVQRRAMYALADVLEGENATRRLDFAVSAHQMPNDERSGRLAPACARH